VAAACGVDPLQLDLEEGSALGIASLEELREVQQNVGEVLQAHLEPVCSAAVISSVLRHVDGRFVELYEVCVERERLLSEEEEISVRHGATAGSSSSGRAAEAVSHAEDCEAEGSGDEDEDYDAAEEGEGAEDPAGEEYASADEGGEAREAPHQSRRERRADRGRTRQRRRKSSREERPSKRRRRH